MTKKPFQGTGTALVTPFQGDGSIDEPALRRLVDMQIRDGVDMLLPCGTTGVGATLEADETERVFRIVIEQARGRALVVVGAGSNSTAKAVKATEQAKMQIVKSLGTLQSRTLGRLQGREAPVGIVVPLPHLPVDAIRLDHGCNASPRRLTPRTAEGRGRLGARAEGEGASLNLQLRTITFL